MLWKEYYRAHSLPALLFIAVVAVAGCHDSQTSPSPTDRSTPPVKAVQQVPRARIGLACVAALKASAGIRIVALSRADLGELLPGLGSRGLADTLQKVLRIQHFKMNDRMGANGFVSCVVPGDLAYTKQLRNAVRSAQGIGWTALATSLSRAEAVSDLRVPEVIATERLRDILLPGARYLGRTKGSTTQPGLMPSWTDENSDPPPQSLPPVTVWGTATQWILDFNFLREIASRSKSFSDVIDWDWYLYGPDCASANDLWYARDAEADGLQDEADNIGLVADALASATCVRITGYPICVDFFIMHSHAFVFLGDNRTFSDTANFSASRVQLYVNPTTRQWQVKWNGSIMIAPGGSAYVTLLGLNDSATVFNPATDVVVDTNAQGHLHVVGHFANNFCVGFVMSLCPKIDAELEFVPDAGHVGGYNVLVNRPGFPSMGVYKRKQDDSGWDKLREDAGHTQHPWLDWLHLISTLRSDNQLPQGCAWT
jgi:hypothetical protein